jgi:glycosyltransferase involved in cell wall biosynthesis
LLIPAYNAAVFLPRLLKSAAEQTEPFDQIWVYDDCSSDGTSTVARAFGAQVLRGDINRGCSAGKNALALHVDADWVHFHDADDELLPNFVALARGWMARGEADVVLFPYEEREDLTGALVDIRRFDAAQVAADARDFAIKQQINPFCGLYRRDAVLRAGGYDEDPLVLYNEDVAFHVRLAFAGLTFAAETEVAIVNHRRMSSMSAANGLKCAQAQFHVMRRTLNLSLADRYAAPIAAKLWAIAGVLAAYRDWPTVDVVVSLARSIAPVPASAGALWFRMLAGISPRAAMRARELAIRSFKPGLRQNFESAGNSGQC